MPAAEGSGVIWGKVFKHWELLSKAFVEPSQTSFPFFFFFCPPQFPFFLPGAGISAQEQAYLGAGPSMGQQEQPSKEPPISDAPEVKDLVRKKK